MTGLSTDLVINSGSNEIDEAYDHGRLLDYQILERLSPEKKGLYLYLAGVAHYIYADTN